METIADIFSEGLIVIIGDLLQLVVIIVFMFAIDWKLSLISLSTIPILLFATRFSRKGYGLFPGRTDASGGAQ